MRSSLFVHYIPMIFPFLVHTHGIPLVYPLFLQGWDKFC